MTSPAIAEVLSLDQLKREVLPRLFDEPSRIWEYGGGQTGSDGLNQLSNLMEGGSVSALAARIGEIVSMLSDADPRSIAKQPTWIDKLLGREVERQARYRVARSSLEQLLRDTEVVALRVRATLNALDKLMLSTTEDVVRLKTIVQAGREYLDENPMAGVPQAGEIEFDKPRERLARKLANLSTLQASHEMGITQMKLTRAQAVDMMDRFSETVSILVPVWRQHTLALITTNNMSPEMVAQATKSHQALMRSLSKSLEGIEQ